MERRTENLIKKDVLNECDIIQTILGSCPKASRQ